MSDNQNTTPESVQQPIETPESLPAAPAPPPATPGDTVEPQEPAETAEGKATEGKAGREAAKYRTQLRAVEAERDTLTAQLEAAREAIVNSHLSGQQISLKVAGIKRLGYSTGDLLNDDLSLNKDALASTLQGIQDSGFSYSKGNGVVSKSGTGQGSPISDAPKWGDAINGGK